MLQLNSSQRHSVCLSISSHCPKFRRIGTTWNSAQRWVWGWNAKDIFFPYISRLNISWWWPSCCSHLCFNQFIPAREGGVVSKRDLCFQFSFEQHKILIGGQKPWVGPFFSFHGQALVFWSGTMPAGQPIAGHKEAFELAPEKWKSCMARTWVTLAHCLWSGHVL